MIPQPIYIKVRERLRREVLVAATLHHPAIIQIYELSEGDGGGSILMEYVEGSKLSELLDKGALDLRTALQIARDVAGGLAAAHAQSLIHLDLKPENILVTPERHAKILGFGLACALENREATNPVVIGTFRYMSPEQVMGLPLDARSDLFSIGMILYEMLTGRLAFAGVTAGFLPSWQSPEGELIPRVPPELSKLVARLLEQDPARRPGSAGEVVSALEAISSAEKRPLLLRKPSLSPLVLVRKWFSRRPQDPEVVAARQARRLERAKKAVLQEFGSSYAIGADEKRWEEQKKIFTVTHQGATYLLDFQFEAKGRPRQTIAEVMRVLGPEISDWGLALWFTAANGWLDGKRPVDLLTAEPGRVVQAAEQEAADLVF